MFTPDVSVTDADRATPVLALSAHAFRTCGRRWLLLHAVCVTALCSVAASQQSIVYVKQTSVGAATGTNWHDAFTDLQQALARATPGSQVWVAEGSYRPDGGSKFKNLAFDLRPGVELYGGFTGDEDSLSQRDPEGHPTILTGDLKGNDTPATFQSGVTFADNSWHVVRGANLDGACVLDGFRIQGGAGHGLQSLCSAQAGSAIVLEAAQPQIRNCLVSMNWGPSGTGAYLLSGSNALFENCVFRDNIALFDGGGAIAMCDSSPLIRNCTFESNGCAPGLGGAILVLESCKPEIWDCLFLKNTGAWGGAICTYGPSRIERCYFVNNTSGQGGAIIFGYISAAIPAVVRNCLFFQNTAHDGGALSITSSSPVVEFATIIGNTAQLFGGGVLLIGTMQSTYIRNTIIYGNSDAGLTTELGAQIDNATTPFVPTLPLSHCCVKGLPPGTDVNGNFGGSPGLVDLAGIDGVPGTGDDEFDLLIDSPCIDTGEPAEGALGVAFNGFPRNLDGNLDLLMRPDIGAYEFSHVRLEVGEVREGLSVNVDVQSQVALWGFVLVGLKDGDLPVEPFGSLLIDPQFGMARIFVGKLPYNSTLAWPAGIVLPRALRLQALGLGSGMNAGSLSNAVWVLPNG